jgi:hypothetical protein
MLRPKASFLGSSVAERRRNLRREQLRAVGQGVRAAAGAGQALFDLVRRLAGFWLLPIAYLAGAYLAASLPLRWAAGHEPLTLPSFGLWALGTAISLIGLFRVRTRAEPVAPVRPEFARGMLFAGWGGALILAICSLSR